MPDFTTDDGVTLHYVTCGEGALPVIYLHWMGGDLSTWRVMWAALGREKYRHVALDFRGHGRSGRNVSTFTNERLSADVLQLADLLGFKRFVVAGHSFGGKVALRLAAMAPERVTGLVLIGAVGPGKVPLAREDVEPILVRSTELSFIRDSFRPWFTVWPHAELDRSLEYFSRTPAWALRAVCEIALWTDLTATIGTLAAPALILAGEHDPVYGPAYQGAAVAPTVPRARSVTIDCGHGLILERPQELAIECNRFLAELNV